MSLLGNLTVGILGNMSGLSNAFTDAQNQTRQFGKSMEKIGSNVSAAGTAITSTFGTMFAVITGGIGLAANEAMNFEQQMSSVKSVMSPDEINKFGGALEDLAIKMGKETKYSSIEAAQGIEELIKAGVSVTDIVNGGLKGALNLAVAGELDLASAAEVASTALNAFRKDNLSVSDAADLLAGAANASATAVGEMQFGLSMVSAVASGVGMSFKDTTTALAAFAQQGLKGSDAGTSLKTMLLNLSPSTDAAATQMAKLGLLTEEGNSAFYDANNSLKSVAEIAELLQTSLAGLGDEQRQMALKTMFGTDAIRAANILYEQGAEGITNMAGAMTKISAADVAATKMDNVKGRIELLIGTVKTAAKEIGDNFLDSIDSVVKVAQKAADWFNGLSDETIALISKIALGAAAFTGLATAFGVVLMVAGGLISSIGTITTAFASLSGALASAGGVLGVITGPIGITVAAVVALGAALIALWKNSETFRNTVTGAFNKVREVAVQAFEIVAKFIGQKIAQIKAFWDTNGASFLQAVENVFNGIKAVIEFVMPAVLFIVKTAWTAIKQVIDGALNIIMGVIKVFSGLFTGNLGQMWEGIKNIFKGAIDFVIGIMTLTFVGGLRTLLTNLLKTGLNLVKGLADGIVTFFRNFATTGQSVANGMVNGVLNFFRNLYNSATSIFNMLRNFGASVWSSLRQTVVNIAQQIWQLVVQRFTSMLNSIRNVFGTVISVVKNIWGNVMSFFRGINLTSIGKDIIRGLINGIGSMASAVWNKAKEIASGIGNTIKKALGIHSPSRVMMGFGTNIGEGLRLGIDKMTKPIFNSAGDLAKMASPRIKSSKKTRENAKIADKLISLISGKKLEVVV